MYYVESQAPDSKQALKEAVQDFYELGDEQRVEFAQQFADNQDEAMLDNEKEALQFGRSTPADNVIEALASYYKLQTTISSDELIDAFMAIENEQSWSYSAYMVPQYCDRRALLVPHL